MPKVPPSPPATLVAAFADGSGALADDGEALASVPERPRLLSASERETRLGALLAGHFRMVWRALRRLGVPPPGWAARRREASSSPRTSPRWSSSGKGHGFLYAWARGSAPTPRRARPPRPEPAG